MFHQRRSITGLFLLGVIAWRGNVEAQSTTVQTRPIGSFNSLYVNGPFVVTVQFGAVESVTVEADPAILPYVDTVIHPWSPLVLVIQFSDNLTVDPAVHYQGPINVTVTAKSLTSLTSVGSGPVTVTSAIQSGSLQVELDGSGDVTAPLQVNSLNVVLTGSGNFIASGKAKNANINISGSGNLEGKYLVSQQVNIAIQSSGNVAIYCENDLTAWIAGSGSVQYGGNPTVNQQIVGSGYITRAF